MPSAAAKAKLKNLPALVLKHQKTLERAKQLYDRADQQLLEIAELFIETCKHCGASRLLPESSIPLNDDGKVARLHDNYEGNTVVWGHGGVRRFGVKISKS